MLLTKNSVVVGARPLTIAEVVSVARQDARIELDPESLAAVESSIKGVVDRVRGESR